MLEILKHWHAPNHLVDCQNIDYRISNSVGLEYD